jgi:hypothetical protein
MLLPVGALKESGTSREQHLCLLSSPFVFVNFVASL